MMMWNMSGGKTYTFEVYLTDHSKCPNIQKNRERHSEKIMIWSITF